MFRAGQRAACSVASFLILHVGRWIAPLRAGFGDLVFLLRGSSFHLCICLQRPYVKVRSAHSFRQWPVFAIELNDRAASPALVISDQRLRGFSWREHVKATIRRGTQTGLRPTIDRAARAAKAEVLGFEKGRKGETDLH